MDRKYNKDLLVFARNLRKNMTKEERRLWYNFLKDYPVKFTRQKIIGRYIVDFYCAKANLVIEVDGSQHFEDEGILKDRERTRYLEGYGLKVIRVTNLDVNKNLEGVCEYIDNIVKTRRIL
ncbi:MAG: endonuclease domain-containing protein [Firmicutes bacterium]|nr:endonuclease domain-containing protein [Bacillota bacterium]